MADQVQFLELFLAQEAQLAAFLRSLVRDPREFEDVFQAVALTLWRKFEQYDPQLPFGPWARGVAAREVLLLRRDQRRRPTPFSPETVAAILDAFERRLAGDADSARLEALEACQQALSAEARDVIRLRYAHSLSITEMATRIGRTSAATQRMLSRVRKQLAECIERRLEACREGRP